MPFMKTLSSRMNVFPCNDFFNSLGKRFVRFFEEFFILLWKTVVSRDIGYRNPEKS